VDRIWAIDNEDFDTDSFPIPEKDLSFALGHKGMIRKKLAVASGCIIEYVGQVAYLAGTLVERARGRDYIRWVLQQLEGEVSVVDFARRIDISSIMLSKRAAGFVNGNKGKVLRLIEEVTGTFCFISKALESTSAGTRPLLICGPDSGRKGAVYILERYIKQYQSTDWGEDATDASAELTRPVFEEMLQSAEIHCHPIDPWKVHDDSVASYQYICQPCPGAARPGTRLIANPSATLSSLIKPVSGENSRENPLEFVNNTEAFPELGLKVTSPQKFQKVTPVAKETPPPVPRPPPIESDSPLHVADAEIFIDHVNGRVWGDWGMGPNGDPTWKKREIKSPKNHQAPKLQGAWK
jgi:hypothetical protein